MRISLICGFAALAMVSGSAAHAQNLLSNASFEDPVVADGPPFVGSFEAFSGGAGAGSGNSTSTPRTGAMSLELSIAGINNTFAGAFQDVVGLTAGSSVVFSGFQMTPSSPNGVASEFRIEFRNSTTAAEISRVQLTSGPTGPTYTQFSVPAIVPVGADTARVVYAIQTFGGEPAPGDTGIVRLDDFSFVVVPEPTTLAALGAAGLLLRRRR